VKICLREVGGKRRNVDGIAWEVGIFQTAGISLAPLAEIRSAFSPVLSCLPERETMTNKVT
jgi:hypothetical protein